MSSSSLRTLAAALVVGAALLASPATAAAEAGDQSVMIYVGGGVVLAAAPVTFLTADFVYGVQGRLVPSGWAVPQLVLGGVEVVYGLIGVGIWTDPNDPAAPSGSELVLPFAVTALVLGAWQIAHGIWSLVVGDDPPSDIAVLGAPVPGGATLQLVGRL